VPLLSSMDYGDFSIDVDEAFVPLSLPHPTDQERTMQVGKGAQTTWLPLLCTYHP
jgi:hypothetical protein